MTGIWSIYLALKRLSVVVKQPVDFQSIVVELCRANLLKWPVPEFMFALPDEFFQQALTAIFKIYKLESDQVIILRNPAGSNNSAAGIQFRVVFIHVREVNNGLEPDILKRVVLDTAGLDLVSDPAVTGKLQPPVGNIDRFNRQERTVFQYQLDRKFDPVSESASALVRYGLWEYHDI